MTDTLTPRPAISRWLIAVPLGLAGPLLSGHGLVMCVVIGEILWKGPDRIITDTTSAWIAFPLAICEVLLGLLMIGGAWLLVRRREGRDDSGEHRHVR